MASALLTLQVSLGVARTVVSVVLSLSLSDSSHSSALSLSPSLSPQTRCPRSWIVSPTRSLSHLLTRSASHSVSCACVSCARSFPLSLSPSLSPSLSLSHTLLSDTLCLYHLHLLLLTPYLSYLAPPLSSSRSLCRCLSLSLTCPSHSPLISPPIFLPPTPVLSQCIVLSLIHDCSHSFSLTHSARGTTNETAAVRHELRAALLHARFPRPCVLIFTSPLSVSLSTSTLGTVTWEMGANITRPHSAIIL